MVETDVRLSADGELFLFHDATGVRTTDVAQVFPERAGDPITSFTSAELRALDTGSYFGAQYAGEKILFLADLPAAVGYAMGINLEIKAPANTPGVEAMLADALNGTEWARLMEQHRVVVSSFDPASVDAFAAAAPHVPVWQLVESVPEASLLARGAGRVQGLVVDYRFLTVEGAAAVRAAGLGLWAYTVNADNDITHMLSLGVDALITDFPGALTERLDGAHRVRRVRRSVPGPVPAAAGPAAPAHPRGTPSSPWTGSLRSVARSR